MSGACPGPPPPPPRDLKAKKKIIPIIEIFFLCIEHLCTHLSLILLNIPCGITLDYYLKFPNSPLSNIFSESVFFAQIFGQNVHKIVINYAVSRKEFSEQHATVLYEQFLKPHIFLRGSELCKKCSKIGFPEI